jgi:hypothetical protein
VVGTRVASGIPRANPIADETMIPSSHTKDSDARTGTFSTTGIVIPAEWNESGEPVRMALSTYGEEMYIVDSGNEAGKAILHLVHQKVRVEGSVYRLVDGRSAIRIERIESQEPPPEPGSEPAQMTFFPDPQDSSRT